MTIEEFINAHKSDSKRYAWHITNLRDCQSQEQFKSLSKDLFDDILSDELEISELYKNGALAKPIEDRIIHLRKTYRNAIQIYSDFKSICL